MPTQNVPFDLYLPNNTHCVLKWLSYLQNKTRDVKTHGTDIKIGACDKQLGTTGLSEPVEMWISEPEFVVAT